MSHGRWLWMTLLGGCLSELPDLADPCAEWPETGLFRVTVESADDRDRRPYVYVPPGQGPRDVVVLLHGGGMSGPRIEEVTGFEDLAERDRFVLVYPNGLGWPTRVWSSGQDAQDPHDDVGFLDRLTDEVSRKVCGGRVLATGFSNGSMMAQRWACEGEFPPVAVAGSSGTLLVDACDGDPLPILYYHGVKDTVVPYNGGMLQGVPLLSVDASMELWRERNRCLPGEGDPIRRGDTTCVEWSCDASTVLCTVAGWPHQWPGGIHSDQTDADATGQIWGWFGDLEQDPPQDAE